MVPVRAHFGCEVGVGFGPMNFHEYLVAVDLLCVDLCFQILFDAVV